MVDTRNWELMPSIGGNRQHIQDMGHLKLKEDTPEVLLIKISLERAFDRFLAGEEGELELELPKTELEVTGSNDLNDSDRAFYAALTLLLRSVNSKSDSANDESLETLYDGQSQSLTSLSGSSDLDTGITSVSLEVEGSRWAVYNKLVNILGVCPPSFELFYRVMDVD